MTKARLAMDFALSAVGSAYVYGATGRPCTPAYRLARAKQYPVMAAAIRRACPVLSGRASSCAGCRHAGKPAYDCAQLVRAALAAAGLRLPSGASSQWKAAGVWAWQGEISHLAARFPCVVFRKDGDAAWDRPMAHVGLSLGDGLAVDARGHTSGVVATRLTAYPWTHMAFPLGFSLPQGLGAGEGPGLNPPAPVRLAHIPSPGDLRETALSPGGRGDLVRALQTRLMMLGYPLPRFGADGRYGAETAGAVRAFQHVAGLRPDGLAGRETLALLYPLPPPPAPDEEPEAETPSFDLF